MFNPLSYGNGFVSWLSFKVEAKVVYTLYTVCNVCNCTYVCNENFDYNNTNSTYKGWQLPLATVLHKYTNKLVYVHYLPRCK